MSILTRRTISGDEKIKEEVMMCHDDDEHFHCLLNLKKKTSLFEKLLCEYLLRSAPP